jgi:hypothetical protein
MKNPNKQEAIVNRQNLSGSKKKANINKDAAVHTKQINRNSLYFLVLSTNAPTIPAPTKPLTTIPAPMYPL